MREHKSWRAEPIIAFKVFVAVFFLTMFVAISVVVGVDLAEPRTAAVFCLAPAMLLALISALHAPTRRFVGVSIGAYRR